MLGYSGWDGDVFMSALKRRLTSGLPTNLYWFCYDRASANRLREALQDFDTESVVLVVPPERSAGVGPPGRVDRDGLPGQLPQCPLELTLDGAPAGLLLPPGELGPVVLQHDLDIHF